MSAGRYAVSLLSERGVTVVALEGEVDISTATDFKECLFRAIAEGARRVVVDLTRVALIDSTGISVLVGGEHRLRAAGGWLVVACGERVERLLVITGLRQAFPLCATREAALVLASQLPVRTAESPPPPA